MSDGAIPLRNALAIQIWAALQRELPSEANTQRADLAADAVMDAVGPVLAERDRLRAAVDAALALHVPVKRYHDGSGEWSTSTPEGAADYADIELGDVEHFEVCGHCGYMETWMHDEAEQDFEYREALWPCPTRRALADPGPTHRPDTDTKET